jgi:outer membrane lipoprotein SlyB
MMKRKFLLFALLLSAGQCVAAASDTKAQNAQYKASEKEAASRYAADKKLCAEETSSSARMQCLRDARADYDKALADAKKAAASTAASAGAGDPKSAAPAASAAKHTAPVCAECGKVVGVVMSKKEGKAGPLGVIGGGVAGALLGSQVGSGTGKNVATIAGAAGGAYAGHKIEEKMKEAKVWAVRVKLDSGEERVIEFDHEPGVKSGDLVKLSGNTITPR